MKKKISREGLRTIVLAQARLLANGALLPLAFLADRLAAIEEGRE